MKSNGAIATAKEFIGAHGIRTMRVAFADLHGIFRAKLLPVDQYLDRLEGGIRFAHGVLGKDLVGRSVDTDSLSFLRGSGDCVAVPDASTHTALPSSPGVGHVFADLFLPDGSPVPYAPRTLLRRVLALADELGVSPIVASEIEFYVLRLPSRVSPQSPPQPYLTGDPVCPDAYLDDIASTLASMQLPVDAVHRENGAGQFEISLRHSTPLRMADQTAMLRYALKDAARSHGLAVTFMPKPFHDQSGSGFHLHQSLWDSENTGNLFQSPQAHRASALALHYVAGQLLHLPASMAVFAPSVNAYKRHRLGRSVPANCTWGYDNRTAALRVLETDCRGARVENRVPASDANPYLVIAVSLASGFLGIRDRLAAPPPVGGDARTADGSTRLPRSLGDALDALTADAILVEVLSRPFVELFSALKRAEDDQYSCQVTNWERRVYLDLR